MEAGMDSQSLDLFDLLDLIELSAYSMMAATILFGAFVILHWHD